MKKNIKNTICMGCIAASGLAAIVSCTDTWDEHYDASSGDGVINGSVMTAIEQNAPDFAKVVKAVGFDRELASDNTYTLWVPVNFNTDSVLALAKTDSAAVVDEFLKNHIARYAISQNDESKIVSLVNDKKAVMDQMSFGATSMVKGRTNIKCGNGVVHMIENSNPYLPNLYELIERQYKSSTFEKKDTVGGSLYAFLRKYNADSLDLARSVSRGVDENGDKIWVDSVVIRNNTVLKNVEALIYEEDSNYLALIPSDKAFNERFNVYKNLFKFNPKENEASATIDVCDSLANHYANMFAMNDLFYNMTDNEHYQDSLKSTTYWYNGPIYSVYYRKDKPLQPKDRPTHDILEGLTPVKCSNGTAYLVDEYPMSVTEQSFRKLAYSFSPSLMAKESDTSNKPLYVTNTSTDVSSGAIYKTGYFVEFEQKPVTIVDDKGEEQTVMMDDSTKLIGSKEYFFYRYEPTKATLASTYSFWLPNFLSGTYDIYIVSCPIWAINGYTGATPENKPYKFTVAMNERDAKGAYKKLAMATKFKHPETKSVDYYTNPYAKIDTTYVGEYTFKYTYYGRGTTETNAGAMIHIAPDRKYSGTMLLSCIILKPKFSEDDEAAATKKRY